MIWTKTEAMEYIEKTSEKKEKFFVTEIETKKWKTEAQRKTYYRCFGMIWDHLWYSKEEIKQMFLKWCFGIRKMKMWKWEYEIANIWNTEELNIEQANFLIDVLTKTAETLWLWIIITPRERQSLFDSY